MTEYRVREQAGVFFVEKKVWLLGWVSVWDCINERKKSFLSLEGAYAYIEFVTERCGPRKPVYHYQIKGNTTPVEPHRED